MLAEIGAGCDAHFLDPYVFVEARFGQTYRIGETPACMDYSGADGVCISLFGDPTYDLGPMYIFIESLGQYVLDWQNAGFATILQCNDTDWGRSDMAGFLAKYCCYLLVRGPNTYFYARNGWGDFDVYHGEPCWYPMYTWESGAPLGPQPTSLDDLKVQSDDLDGNPTDIWYYRRDFVNGSVVVVPSMAYEHPDSGIAYEYLDIYGGGVVDEDGNKSGTAQWIKMSPISTPGFLFNEASTWIIRPETEE